MVFSWCVVSNKDIQGFNLKVQKGKQIMNSIKMTEHFEKLEVQRNEMSDILSKFKGNEWERPLKNKWSFGETYYHLYLLIKWFRRLNIVYLPISKKIAVLRKHKAYLENSADVYVQYQNKHKRPMRAPSILVPPKDIEKKVTFTDVLELLDKETNHLKEMVSLIDDATAGHIRYPDPLANNPNLIQSIDLIGIHEKHHFNLCKKYYS